MARRQLLWEKLRQCQKSGPGNILVHRGKEQAANWPELEWCVLPQDWVGWDLSWILLSIANGVQSTPEIWKRAGLDQKHTLTWGGVRLPGQSRLLAESDKEVRSSGRLSVSSLWLCSLNCSLHPALSSTVGCCEGTSGKLWNQDLMSTGYLPTIGRSTLLSCMHWVGGSSMDLDGKHQGDVTTCEVSRCASYLLVQTMTS